MKHLSGFPGLPARAGGTGHGGAGLSLCPLSPRPRTAAAEDGAATLPGIPRCRLERGAFQNSSRSSPSRRKSCFSRRIPTLEELRAPLPA